MSKTHIRRTVDGKGNMGMFIERDPKVCAAGVPSAQAGLTVSQCLQYYLLQDEVDALLNDTIIPSQKPLKLPPLRYTKLPDLRNAGIYTEGSQLINPPTATKFQTLVDDLKNTSYSSYWKKSVGKVRDPSPMLPPGFDGKNTTFGKKVLCNEHLYDVIMPHKPVPDKTHPSKSPAYQTDRNYCKSSFNRNMTFGKKSNIDLSGRLMKCCLTDDEIELGTALWKPMNMLQVKAMTEKKSKLGSPLAPNDNIRYVPEGFVFGKSEPPENRLESPTGCRINPEKETFKKCLGHLNSVRRYLCKRFEVTFFREFYLKLNYLDKCKTGWLPKDIVYNLCDREHIRFDPSLIEPLLSTWNSFNGTHIEYKTFVHVINFREVSPELPKVSNIPEDCVDFRTTYGEMTKPGMEVHIGLRAGTSSGRYFDKDDPVTPEGYCKANRYYLPQESDAKTCLNPTILNILNVSHRDMYAKREPGVIKRVFEAAGENFTDDVFESIWIEAKKHHPQGFVCYETFRRALHDMKTATGNV